MLWNHAALQSGRGQSKQLNQASLGRIFSRHARSENSVNTVETNCILAGNKATITSKERFYDKNEDQGPDEWTDTSMDWTRTDTSMDQGPSFRSMTKQDYLSLYGMGHFFVAKEAQ